MKKGWALAVWLGWRCYAQQVPQPVPQNPAELQQELERRLEAMANQREASITRAPARPTGQSVSVYRLRHKVPKAAEKSYERARKLSRSGDHAGAVAELERTVQIDPLAAVAYDRLGAEYGQLGRLEEAKPALERAVELDPDSWSAQYNLSLALYFLGDRTGAEQHARRALAVASEEAQPHWLLGVLLYPDETTRGEGLEHLRYAARTIKEAKALLRALPEK